MKIEAFRGTKNEVFTYEGYPKSSQRMYFMKKKIWCASQNVCIIKINLSVNGIFLQTL